MLPALVVLAALGIHLVSATSARPVVVRVLVVVAVAWGVWVNAALGTWTLGLKSPGFTELRYRVDGALFPAPSPGLVALEPAMPVPRDGVVAVEPDCAGVYVAEQGSWVALERAVGRRVVSGDVSTGAEVLVAGDGWMLSLDDPGPPARLRLTVDDVTVAELEAGRLVPGDQVEVVADPVTREFFVRTAERVVFLDPRVPGVGDVLVGIDLDASPSRSSTHLCRILEARR
jgi:hypothetical protein